MIEAAERVRFRTGESPNKPIGGNIVDKPFLQILHGLAASRGFDSQRSLARALGSSQGLVGTWYRGESFPSSELFGRLLVVLNLTDEERESLVKFYDQKPGRKNSDSALRMSRRMIRLSDNPIGKWFENLCEEKGLTLSQGSEKLGSPALQKRRRYFSLRDLHFVRQNAKDAFDLSEDKLAILLETIEEEKQYKIEKGHKFQSGPKGRTVIKEQKKLNYRTWNGAQAAVEVGVTRARISQLREKFSFPVLLTEDHIEQLKNYRAKIEERREKQKSRRVA